MAGNIRLPPIHKGISLFRDRLSWDLAIRSCYDVIFNSLWPGEWWRHVMTYIWIKFGSINGLHVVWLNKAITWTNVDFSSIRFCGMPPESNFTESAQEYNPQHELENFTLKMIGRSAGGQSANKRNNPLVIIPMHEFVSCQHQSRLNICRHGHALTNRDTLRRTHSKRTFIKYIAELFLHH